MIKDLEGDHVLIRQSNGVFKIGTLSVRSTGEVFARLGSGFLRVYADGSTSQPGTTVVELHTDAALYKDPLGRLTMNETKGKRLAGTQLDRLLIGKE